MFLPTRSTSDHFKERISSSRMPVLTAVVITDLRSTARVFRCLGSRIQTRSHAKRSSLYSFLVRYRIRMFFSRNISICRGSFSLMRMPGRIFSLSTRL